MTKAENRAAAKAWHQEWERQRREEEHAEALKAELAELDRFRKYLLRGRLGHTSLLIDAIEDYVEKISGTGPSCTPKITPLEDNT